MGDLDDIRFQQPPQPRPDPDLSLRPDPSAPASESSSFEPSSPQDREGTGSDGNRSRWLMPLLAFVALLLVGGAVLYYFWLRTPTAPEIGTVATASTEQPSAGPEARPPAPVADPDPDFELPELSTSDEVVRGMVGAISSHPKIAEWLVNDDLIRRFTLAVANVAYDEDPAVHVPFLRPAGSFEASVSGEGFVLGPETHRRYDLLVAAFTSIDPEGAAELYRRFEPLMQQQYEELGYPGRFRGALRRAVLRVLETPAPGEVELEPWIDGYRFADERLEALPPAHKVLLRMGPQHQRRVQDHVRRLWTAIDRVTA